MIDDKFFKKHGVIFTSLFDCRSLFQSLDLV